MPTPRILGFSRSLCSDGSRHDPNGQEDLNDGLDSHWRDCVAGDHWHPRDRGQIQFWRKVLGHMAKGRGATDGWCILRTRGGSTLKLASSLADSGVEAWTPTATITKRKGRARDRVDAPMPILPTFVFVKSVYVSELQRICALVMSPHPAFSIFRYLNRIPVLSDRDISSLKDAEDRATMDHRKQQRKVVPIGTHVRLDDGAFAGLPGVVEQSDGKSAIVAFGSNFRVEIATWLLPQDLLEASVSNSDTAAQAA